MGRRVRLAAARSGRKPSAVTVVAVTKKFSANRIRDGYDAGLRSFGENYVQEFERKRPLLGDLEGASYHLIGHLQSNKVKAALDLFQVIETVDSAKLLRRLDALAGECGVMVEAMLEVKLAEEENKTGASVEELPALAEAAAGCKHANVTGLMTVPPWSEDGERSRPYFRKLAELGRQFGFTKLSMGMSGDFEVAIEEGATTIRLGTALFGPRPKPTAASTSVET